MKNQEIDDDWLIKLITIAPDENMNVCTKLHANLRHFTQNPKTQMSTYFALEEKSVAHQSHQDSSQRNIYVCEKYHGILSNSWDISVWTQVADKPTGADIQIPGRTTIMWM